MTRTRSIHNRTDKMKRREGERGGLKNKFGIEMSHHAPMVTRWTDGRTDEWTDDGQIFLGEGCVEVTNTTWDFSMPYLALGLSSHLVSSFPCVC